MQFIWFIRLGCVADPTRGACKVCCPKAVIGDRPLVAVSGQSTVDRKRQELVRSRHAAGAAYAQSSNCGLEMTAGEFESNVSVPWGI